MGLGACLFVLRNAKNHQDGMKKLHNNIDLQLGRGVEHLLQVEEMH